MGRGSKTRESGVTKERPQRSATGSGSGGGNSHEKQSDSCLFSFKGKLQLSENNGADIKVSSVVIIVPNASNSTALEIYINGKNVGSYTGSRSKQIAECIKKGYTYEGSVEAVAKSKNGFSVSFQIQGLGR